MRTPQLAAHCTAAGIWEPFLREAHPHSHLGTTATSLWGPRPEGAAALGQRFRRRNKAGEAQTRKTSVFLWELSCSAPTCLEPWDTGVHIAAFRRPWARPLMWDWALETGLRALTSPLPRPASQVEGEASLWGLWARCGALTPVTEHKVPRGRMAGGPGAGTVAQPRLPGAWSQPPVSADGLAASSPPHARTHVCRRRTASREAGVGVPGPLGGAGPPGRPGRPEAQEATLVEAGQGVCGQGLGHSCGPREGTHIVKTDITGQLPLLSCTKWGPEQAPCKNKEATHPLSPPRGGAGV